MTTRTSTPNAMLVYYNDDPPGSGKSYLLRQRISTRPGRHLYCAPTLALLEEAEQDVRNLAEQAGMRDILVVPITSKTLKGKRGVAAEIAAAPTAYRNQSHVVVLSTHAGLMSADLSGFTDWTLSVDEVMSTVATGAFRAAALWSWLDTTYHLNVVEGTDWAEVSHKGDQVAAADLLRDTHLKPLSEFHRLASSRSRRLLIDVSAWNELSTGRELVWWSYWPLTDARAFSEVTIVANAFVESVMAQLAAAWEGKAGDVVYERLTLGKRQARVKRSATIHFFSNSSASTAVWASAAGRADLGRIAAWLKAKAPQTADHLLWSGNDVVRAVIRSSGLGGTEVAPVQAGINRYSHIPWVVMIFSAKMTPQEGRALRLFNPKADDVRVAREFEAVGQFMLRGSLRDPSSSAHAHLCVYDRDQAEWLKEFLTTHEFANPVEVMFEEVGVVGRAAQLTKADPTEAKERKRQNAAERQRKKRMRDREKARRPS